jgi:regulator of sigma E protease
MFSVIGERVTPAVISTVGPGTAAARAGFLPGDRIISADGRALSTQMELTEYVQPRDGRPIDFGVIRGNRQIHLIATPALVSVQNDFNLEQHAGQLGVYITGGHWQRYALPEAAAKATQRTWSVISTTVFYIGRMISGQVSGDQIGGPLRIATVAGAVASTSLHQHVPLAEALADTGLNLLNLAAFVSVSLGFANLLPIPVLDGGHLLFYAYEAVARRPLGARLQAAGYRLGLALLLCLMLFATWNDLHLFRVFRSLGGLFS